MKKAYDKLILLGKDLSMLFDDPNHKLVWKPFYIQVVRMYWMGSPKTEIAQQLGLADSTVNRILTSERGQQIIADLEANTFDAMLEVQTIAQAVSPEVIREKIRMALYDPDPKIRSINGRDVLQIAGHVPVHKVAISRADPLIDKYKDKSELDLRKELLALARPASSGPVGDTIPTASDADEDIVN